MMNRGLPAVLVAAVLLASCGAFVPVADLNTLTPEQRSKVNEVQILSAQRQLADSAKVLTLVEGHSCKNQMWDPSATRTAAIEQLKFHAQEAGANALANIQCGIRERTSTSTNCWELISCTAEAVLVAPNGK